MYNVFVIEYNHSGSELLNKSVKSTENIES
jgi:hypothetical protein